MNQPGGALAHDGGGGRHKPKLQERGQQDIDGQVKAGIRDANWGTGTGDAPRAVGWGGGSRQVRWYLASSSTPGPASIALSSSPPMDVIPRARCSSCPLNSTSPRVTGCIYRGGTLSCRYSIHRALARRRGVGSGSRWPAGGHGRVSNTKKEVRLRCPYICKYPRTKRQATKGCASMQDGWRDGYGLEPGTAHPRARRPHTRLHARAHTHTHLAPGTRTCRRRRRGCPLAHVWACLCQARPPTRASAFRLAPCLVEQGGG